MPKLKVSPVETQGFFERIKDFILKILMCSKSLDYGSLDGQILFFF